MRWVWILAGLGIVYLTATSLASSYVTATITARPMVLVRGDTRVPVWLPQTMAETQPAGTARMSVGNGFGKLLDNVRSGIYRNVPRMHR